MAVTSGTVRVLHVDDNPDFAEMAATFLTREDERFEVETATGAGEGIDRLDRGRFDCVVSDYEMPGQNGIEFLERVRETHPDLPFILFTGRGSEEIASEAISSGVTDYLQKRSGTSQYAVLANRVANAVEQHRAKQRADRIEEEYRLAAETATDAFWTLDTDTEAVRMDGLRNFGYTDCDPDREWWKRRLHPEDRDRILERDDDLFAGETDAFDELDDDRGWFTNEYRWRREDGTYADCLERGVVVFGDDGPVKIVGTMTDVTERRERERELERYEAYLEESTDIITVLDESGTIEYESPSVTRILGYEQGELIGQNGFDYIHPDDVEEISETFGELVSEPGGKVTVECRFRTTGGEWRWLEVRGTNQLDHPAIEGIVTNNRDITERKQQERKREQIIDRVTDAIVEVDSDWRFTLVNDQAEELYDMDEESLLGREFWDVFSGAEGTRFEEEYRDVMETREPTSFTEYYAGLDGWFDIEVYPKDDGGVAFYFIEVTERRQRREELERQSERFRYVEEVADIGYWEIDLRSPRPHDVTLSDGVYRVHDLPPDEPIDIEKGLQFYHPEDRPTIERAVERAISDGRPYDHELRLITASGRERWVHTVGEPVERDGEVVTVRGVFQDVTERKRKEQELARQNERLDEFASIVSHDLQNPLNVAEAQIELARDDCDSEHLGGAADAVGRCQALVEDLLTLAREGQEVGDLEPVGLAEMVERSWGNVSTAGADLRIDTEQTIRADRSRLGQLLENLVRNAVEHGGDTVTVTVGEMEDGFYVADDGPGVPEDKREQVFEAGHSTVDGGTGFGLAIVEGIATAHDWEVRVTGSEGGGARFEITGVEPA